MITGIIIKVSDLIATASETGMSYSGSLEIVGLEWLVALILGSLVALTFWVMLKTG